MCLGNHLCLGKQWVLHTRVCPYLNYPASKGHEPYCLLFTVPIYHIFPHYLTTGKIFGKKGAEYTMCFDFSTNFLWSISHFKENWVRYTYNHKYTRVSICVEKKNQLDATEWFIALIICSTCFGQFRAHHQELENVCVLLSPMVCNALVAGGRRSGAGHQAMRPEWGLLLDWVEQHHSFRTHSLLPCTWPPTTSNQDIAHHRP